MARLSISGLYNFADMQYVNLWQIFIWLHFVKFFSEVRFWRLGSLFFIAVTIEAVNEENTYFKVLKSWSSMTCRITVAAH